MKEQIKKHIVHLIESERGWGRKVDEVIKFDTEKEALDYCKDYNGKHNTKKEVPDWYMVAEYVGEAIMKTP